MKAAIFMDVSKSNFRSGKERHSIHSFLPSWRTFIVVPELSVEIYNLARSKGIAHSKSVRINVNITVCFLVGDDFSLVSDLGFD